MLLPRWLTLPSCSGCRGASPGRGLADAADAVFVSQEHHLQRAIVAGLIIPTPEVFQVDELDVYNRCYPSEWKMPRQLIHMQRESLSRPCLVLHFNYQC